MTTGTTSVEARPSSAGIPTAAAGNRTLLYLAYAAVYIIWGSTFFAIRIGIESLPPLLLPALRHFSVGLIFYPIFRYVSREKPTLFQWRTAIVTGCLLLCIGNGTVSWAEKIVPSGIAALLVATVSLWMVLIDWLRPGGSRPVARVLAGLVLGFAGMALLVGPKDLGGSDRINPLGTLVLVIASFAWAAGSVYSKHHPQPNSPLLGVAMQCLAGGTALLIAAALSGELRGFHLGTGDAPLVDGVVVSGGVGIGSGIQCIRVRAEAQCGNARGNVCVRESRGCAFTGMVAGRRGTDVAHPAG